MVLLPKAGTYAAGPKTLVKPVVTNVDKAAPEDGAIRIL